MHQAILMNADVDESSELGHIGDDAFERHPYLQVRDLLDVVLKAGREKRIARVAPGFAQLFQNIVQSIDSGGQTAAVEFLQQRGLFYEPLYWHVQVFGDLFHHRVGLGMHSRDVERVFALADSQETGGLLESLGADAGHGGQLNAGSKTAMLIAELDDLLRHAFVDAGHVAQQRPGSGVQVHANAVDAAFNYRLQGFMQMALIHVMLLLANADGLGVQVHQLGKRVLQTARDGDGSAYGQIEIGKLLARNFGGGING